MVVRKYNIPDADMMEDSRATRLIFNSDKATFIAVDPYFDDPFSADWLASIEASEAAETAETREDQQEQETAEVEEVMAQARAIYNDVKYYVELVFADKPAIQKKFGLDNYNEAATSQNTMALFLKNLHTQCIVPANQALLTAAGLTLPQIGTINSLYTNLTSENSQQDAFIKTSGSATDARVTTYNATYAMRQRVNRASKVAFADNPTKLNEYKLPGGSSEESFNVEGKVTDAANNRGLYKVTVTLVELEISDRTTTLGNYGFVEVPPGTYTLRFTLAGYTTVERPITVLQSGKVVENVSMQVV